MGILDLFKRKPPVEGERAEIDKDDVITDIYDAVCEKCEYGDALERLNHYERVLYITQMLEMEVNNGGFSQFFYNSAGDLSGELVQAFTEIGALKTAHICQKALDAFGCALPADREERQQLLEELESDETEEALEACDDAFYEYEEDLESLNYAYIMNHRAYFS